MLVDGSGSINYDDPHNFDRIKKFMKAITRRLNVAKTGTHIGIILYSSNVQVISTFEQHIDVNSLEAVIDGMKPPGMGTLTGKGLDSVKTSLFSASARPEVPDVLLVITDGASQDDVLQPSASLRNMGVTIFAIGIGKNFNQKQLEDMATNPDSQHVFQAGFKALDSLIDTIINSVCQGKSMCPRIHVQGFWIALIYRGRGLGGALDRRKQTTRVFKRHAKLRSLTMIYNPGQNC